MKTRPWKDKKVCLDAVEEEEARVLKEEKDFSAKEDNLTFPSLLAFLLF